MVSAPIAQPSRQVSEWPAQQSAATAGAKTKGIRLGSTGGLLRNGDGGTIAHNAQLHKLKNAFVHLSSDGLYDVLCYAHNDGVAIAGHVGQKYFIYNAMAIAVHSV